MYNDLLVKSYMDIPRNKRALAIKEVFVVSQKRARKVFTMVFFYFFKHKIYLYAEIVNHPFFMSYNIFYQTR